MQGDGESVTIPPRERTRSGADRTKTPATRTSPSLGARIPVTILLIVVFPVPFGLRSATISPAPTVKVASMKAVSRPKRRETPQTSIMQPRRASGSLWWWT